MPVAIETVDDIAILKVPSDYLDASNAKQFKREMHTKLKDTSQVVFDLSQLRFVDSSGLGAILACLRQLNKRGGDLKLCGMNRQVRVMFELVRMHRIFEIFNNREEAMRAFQIKEKGGEQ